jgi:hypothetical protein
MSDPVVPVVDLDRIRRALVYLDALLARHPELAGEQARARLAEALGNDDGGRVSCGIS